MDRPNEKPWSDLAVVRYNETYGNYVVASRRIEEGELIIKELPLAVCTYGTSDNVPYCMTCGKPVTDEDRCGQCAWPICNSPCETDPLHASGECPILSKNLVRPDIITESDYSAIEVLRGLGFRQADPVKWDRILGFESHCTGRRANETAKALTDYIMDFIRTKCQLDVDHETLDRVIGSFQINTFWSLNFTSRNLSLLFDHVTMIAHDCDPNTSRDINMEPDKSDGSRGDHYIEIVATRAIQPGEPISIYYTNPNQRVHHRQKYLLEYFYFTCQCTRCVREFLEDDDDSGSGCYEDQDDDDEDEDSESDQPSPES